MQMDDGEEVIASTLLSENEVHHEPWVHKTRAFKNPNPYSKASLHGLPPLGYFLWSFLLRKTFSSYEHTQDSCIFMSHKLHVHLHAYDKPYYKNGLNSAK